MDKQPPPVHVVSGPSAESVAHYARLAVLGPLSAMVALSAVALANSNAVPRIVVVPAHVETTGEDPEPLAVNLVALQGLGTIGIAAEVEDVEANLTAIQSVLRRQGAVGFIARVDRNTETGQVQLVPILEQDADRITSPASTIKLLTASAIYSLVVPLAERAGVTPMEYMQNTMMTVSAEAASQPGSGFGLQEGDQISLLAVLYAMAGLSANDATIVGTDFIAQQTGMDPLQYINQYAQTLGATQTQVSIANGLHFVDFDDQTGADNQTTARDGGRIAAHIILNQPELALIFNQPGYDVRTTGGGVPRDDQVVTSGADGAYDSRFRTSVQVQLDRSVAGRRLSDTARNALLLAKTGFTADSEINGGRILLAFAGPNDTQYVMFVGEIGNNGRAGTPVFEGQRRFPAVNLIAGRAVEALWRGHDAPAERADAALPVALAIMPRDETYCVQRSAVAGTDLQRCPRGRTQLAAR